MHITIVGGGFGGIKTALELAGVADIDITLISDKSDFQYYPALYGAATGRHHLESWVPLTTVLAGKKNIKLVIDTITSIDPAAKKLSSQSGKTYSYEQCVLALGSVTTYFGIKGLDTYAYGIKSAEEIERLKSHLYDEIAMQHTPDKHYVVVGAGPTGVELAAALGSYIASVCKYYKVKKRTIHVDLIEAAPRVLPKMSEAASRTVHKRLKKLGVTIQISKSVGEATADSVMVGGKPLSSHTIIWTSGVMNHPFYKQNAQHFTLAPNGRVQVDQYLKANKDVYVIGDNAATPFSGLAQTALHDALFVSANIMRQASGKLPKKYHAIRPPVVVPVGEHWALFEWHKLRISGWLASLIRRAADFVGYTDMLPLGQALGVWHASLVSNDDNLMPTKSGK